MGAAHDGLTGETQTASLYLEEQKLAFDFVKHLTTLSTGTIVVLTTFAKDVFRKPEWHVLIPLAFASFVLATIALSIAAFGLLNSVRHPGGAPPSIRALTGLSTIVGMVGFSAGLLLLSTFAIKNWA